MTVGVGMAYTKVQKKQERTCTFSELSAVWY